MFTDRTEHWLNVIFRDAVRFPRRQGIILPSGTTGERPTPPEQGYLRYNEDDHEIEGYFEGPFPGWKRLAVEGNALKDIINVGVGEGIFKQTVGFTAELKSLQAGANVTITDTGDELIIASTGGGGGGGEVNTASNLGAGEGVFQAKVGVDLQFKSLVSADPGSLSISSSSTEISFDLLNAPYLPISGGTMLGDLIMGATTNIRADVGTANFPPYTFDTDQDSGMFWGGPNTLGFSTGGVGRLFIGSNGVLSVPPAANYETLVISDWHIPNKKYVDDQISGIGTQVYRQAFSDANLVGGIVQFAHNIGQDIVSVMIYDDNDNVITPAEITSIDANTTEVNLIPFGTIPGIWNVIVIG